MKKITYYLIAFFFAAFSWQGMAQQYLTEDFESGTLPTNWSLEYVSGSSNFGYQDGGKYSNPANAHGGSFNAIFYVASYSGDATKLITSSIDLSTATSPELNFWHAQDAWGSDQDELSVYYKTSATGTWTLLQTWTNEITSWTKETISLPNPSSEYYIAFEGTSDYGYGVVIDDITVAERPEYAPVATLAELRAGTVGEKYEFTGTGYATAARSSASGNGSVRVFGQDDTAGMQFYAANGVITSVTMIDFGDGFTGVKGVLTEAYDNLVFVVEHDITPDGNQEVTPQVVTAQDYIDNREDYESELIQILNTTISNPDNDLTFVQNKSYTISDDSNGSLELGVIFPQLNGNIPATASITGIAVENNGDAGILPRGDTDIEEYTKVETLAELRAGTSGYKYEFTGEGFATAARSSSNGVRVFGQDATAGMQFFAATGVISATNIGFGDGVTEVKGVLTEVYDNLVFVVDHDITFTGNNQPITPEIVTAQNYINNREDYESELIQILNTTIDPNGDTTFGESNTNYAITDPTGALTLGVIFPQLNGNIPAHANVTGIAVEYFGNAFILPRGDVDVEEIPCPDVMNILADNFTGTSANLSWDTLTDATGYNWEIQPQGTAQGTTPAVDSGSVLINAATTSSLAGGTAYTLYVQSNCGSGALGTWMSYDFTSPIPGETCDAPIVIDATALPYTTSDDTANYGDDYENVDSTCSSYYLSGDDVVYSFTPTADGSFNIIMSNIGATYSAIYVMDACLTGAETCVGFVGNSSTDDRELNNLALEGGTEYFIVISTWATPQSTTYDLEITENSCTNATVTYTAVEDCTNSQFTVNVEITNMGTATAITISDDQGSTSQSTMATGIYNFGPYPNGTNVTYTVVDDNDGTCAQDEMVSFTCPIPGETCDAPIVIDATALPYTTSDDTANYGDDYENADSTCSSLYLSGDDVVYSFTPTADGSFNIIMSNIGATYSAIYVMDACLTGAETCVGFVGNSSTDDRELNNLALEGGTEYFIVISTWATPQSTTYDLEITENTASVDDLMSVGFNYYPNPVEDTLTMTANENITSIAIFNMLGQQVKQVNPSSLNATIDMTSIANGTYFIKATVGEKVGTFKIIKK